MKEIIFPELDDQTDFAGYNLGQLRQFYALVFLNFHFIRWVESELDASAGEKRFSFGSNPLYLGESEFGKLVSVITGLDAGTSRAIISDLTFNPSSLHTSISIQPDGISTLIRKLLAGHAKQATAVFEDYESEIAVGEWTVRRYQHKISAGDAS